jgi:hypothetical protein
VDAGVLANSLGTAREFDSEITLRWKSLKTQAILCGWVTGIRTVDVGGEERNPIDTRRVGCENLVTPLGHTRARCGRDDRGAQYEPRMKRGNI